MCLTCSMLPESYAQRAENLNLNRIVQPPYHCYGRLADGCPHAEELGWKVGVQFYTFHKYTFFEAIDLTRALGLHYIEATIGARICEESTQNIHAGLSPEWRERIKRKLAESGVKCESIYYWMDGSGKGFEDIVKFCKDMGWMIVSDPRRAEQGGQPVAFYEKILEKHGVKMVFTNHPKAAAYWNPDFTVEDTQNHGSCIGASIDIGHYMRGGFDTYEITRRYIDIGKMYHFHSTGAEDYFGGAWSFADFDEHGRMRENTFTGPYLGFPFYSQRLAAHRESDYWDVATPVMRGLYRWHIPDPIPMPTPICVSESVTPVWNTGFPSLSVNDSIKSNDISSLFFWLHSIRLDLKLTSLRAIVSRLTYFLMSTFWMKL